MSPLEEYISIIHNRQQDPLSEGQYGERHHVIPRACGGCNRKWNLVRLTPEEHYRCHYLLTFIYATGKEHEKMVYAWWLLSNTRGEFISEEEYARLKAEHSRIVSAAAKHYVNPMKGKHHTEEWKKHHSEVLKGRPSNRKGCKASLETRQKMSAVRKGRPGHPCPWKGKKRGPFSEEHRRHLSEACKGRIPWNKGKRKVAS